MAIAVLGLGAAALADQGGDAAAEAQVQAQAVATACGTGSNMPAALCTCIGTQASAELNAEQQAFVIAAFAGDDAEAQRLRGVVPPLELAAAAMFMVNAPRDCAAGGD
ncbi:hypothetical protein [Pararhodobacter oceanensis]|uniref:hypothetical protein n=1 Tax=Pararhodobacter oceanensis TaxID=2172121 RepID=UPI003A95887C